VAQSKDLGVAEKWDLVLDTYRDVNLLFGDIVKVTPSSKCVGDLALYLIKNKLTTEDIRKQGDKFQYPDSVVSLMMGDLGFPHHGFPKDIQAKILKGAKPLTKRPGLEMPAHDLKAEKEKLEKKFAPRKMTEEDVISYVLYPKVFEDFLKWEEENGNCITHLPTTVFFSGMIIGETTTVLLPDDKSAGKLVLKTLKLTRIAPLTSDNCRILEFQVGGQEAKVKIKDQAVQASKSRLRTADPGNPHHVASSLPGTVEVVYVGIGSEVKKGDPLVMVSAMKMEVQVKAPYDGKIDHVESKVGDRVDVGTLLVIVIPK